MHATISSKTIFADTIEGDNTRHKLWSRNAKVIKQGPSQTRALDVKMACRKPARQPKTVAAGPPENCRSVHHAVASYAFPKVLRAWRIGKA